MVFDIDYKFLNKRYQIATGEIMLLVLHLVECYFYMKTFSGIRRTWKYNGSLIFYFKNKFHSK